MAVDIRRSTAEQLYVLAGQQRFARALGDSCLLNAILAQLLGSRNSGEFAQTHLAAVYLSLLERLIKVRLLLPPSFYPFLQDCLTSFINSYVHPFSLPWSR
jgi:hydroxyethylthiazole kinase-like sugar kinase family protein